MVLHGILKSYMSSKSIAEGVSLKNLLKHINDRPGNYGAIKRLLPSEFLEFNDIKHGEMILAITSTRLLPRTHSIIIT